VKILAVDDKEDALYLLQAMLDGQGHEVITATNGKEALEMAHSNPPDIIISDILMPVMDGFRLCQETRKDQMLKNVLFVFYTATYTEKSDENFARQIGADAFIRKPTEPDSFLAQIETIVDKARPQDQRTEAQPSQEVEILRTYSERLVAKLEKRNIDLQQELAARRRVEEELRRYAERLESLHHIHEAILDAQSPEAVASIVIEGLQSILLAQRICVISFDQESSQATTLAERSYMNESVRTVNVISISDFGDLTDLSSGEVRTAHDLTEAANPAPLYQQLLDNGIKSHFLVPLIVHGKLIGTLCVGFSSPNRITQAVISMTTELANPIALAITQAQLREKLQERVVELSKAKNELEASNQRLSHTLKQTVHALAAEAEVRDQYTAGHQRRVAKLAVAIAKDIHLHPFRTEGLEVAALMHDIGKIAIPIGILSKTGKVSPAEFAIIKTHPEVAYKILCNVDFPWPVAAIVLQHHERMDGSGYPKGLKGEQILLEARMLAVADVVEAMSSHRPYRPSLGIHAALEEIQRNSGKLYDKEIVNLCVRQFEIEDFQFDEKSTNDIKESTQAK
jgi:putative nucleotidyltransferase with HDIG domain